MRAQRNAQWECDRGCGSALLRTLDFAKPHNYIVDLLPCTCSEVDGPKESLASD